MIHERSLAVRAAGLATLVLCALPGEKPSEGATPGGPNRWTQRTVTLRTSHRGNADRKFWLAPNLRRTAEIAIGNGVTFVVDNGVEGPEFSSLIGPPMFSADSSLLCYLAAEVDDASTTLVVNGERIATSRGGGNLGGLVLGPRGHRYAYQRFGQRDDGTLLCSTVIDGVPGPDYWTVWEPQFSANGEHTLYLANVGGMEAGPTHLVLDGQEHALREGFVAGAVVSNAGRAAYTVVDGAGAKFAHVIDGVVGRFYDEVQSLAFSPDGAHTAFAARRGSKGIVVVDGVEHPVPRALVVSPLLYSGDGARLAFVVQRFQDRFVRVLAPGSAAATEYGPYSRVDGAEPWGVFSADATKISYGADDRLYINGKGERPNGGDGPALFSESGKTWARYADGAIWVNGRRRGGGAVYSQSLLMVPGTEWEAYLFTPNEPRRMGVMVGGKQILRPTNGAYIRETWPILVRGKKLAYVIQRDGPRNSVVLERTDVTLR
jgi:hypothetical protein